MDATGNTVDVLNGENAIILEGNVDSYQVRPAALVQHHLGGPSIRSRESRMRALFDKINFTTLGAESDYKELFSNTIYQLYKQIDEELTKLAQHMSAEIESTYGMG